MTNASTRSYFPGATTRRARPSAVALVLGGLGALALSGGCAGPPPADAEPGSAVAPVPPEASAALVAIAAAEPAAASAASAASAAAAAEHATGSGSMGNQATAEAGQPGQAPAAGDALDREAAPPSSEPGPPTRIYAKTRFVWVNYRPASGSGWLGFLWLGGYAELKSPTPVAGNGGCNAWYAVKPRGYVCGDGDGVTLDPDDPVLVALRPYAPKKDSPWPHKYGESRGVERYFKLPTVAEQRGREFQYDEQLARVEAARKGEVHRSLIGVDVTPGSTDPLLLPIMPRTLRESRGRLQNLSTVAWSRDFEDPSGRSFLVSGDLAFVPKDRVMVYPHVSFHGAELKGDVQLPIAFFKEKARPQYRLGEGGEIVANGKEWPRLAWVQLTNNVREWAGTRYLETRDGLYVDASDTTAPTPQPRTPWGAKVGEPDTTGKAPAGRATWLEASVYGGWIIAYEGTRPVYVTLISPGRGGIPVGGIDPVDTASTPVGSWAITGKFVTATMVAPHEFIHSDVPWTQNFHGPHALHGAYWHDAWGEKKSAGCVNVSPIDGRWLFHWTDPPLPEGWHGIRWEKEYDPATQMVVHS
jgi:hypothetical protein